MGVGRDILISKKLFLVTMRTMRKTRFRESKRGGVNKF